ncbi:serine/threonine protein kinase [Nostoc sp.]|uniref:serine/threonine protein kinase n=1 Tax=Nostoc sp. TaxID=1180 RepID=UPI002FF94355
MNSEIFNQRYQVQRELGRQTGRRTFLALDLHSSQQVVVKILCLGQDFNWQDLKLFQREAETLKALDYPAIPRYIDYFELDTPDDKGFGLVQTYVGAKSLEEHLQAGRTFSEAEVKELTRSLLTILSYLHHQQPSVIHRDIKPSNILLTNRSGNSVGQIYLVDFGSVQTLAAQEGGTITVVGTYGYMPPEQFGGRVTPASDLYSLGATLIYLVTGLHPTELPQQELRIQFRQSCNLSLEFADWLEWITEPSLDQRFSTTEVAMQALEKPPSRKQTTLALKKPFASKIHLIKTSKSLEILLPSKGFSIGLIMLISLVTPLALGFNFLTIGVVGSSPPIKIIGFCIQGSAIALLLFAFIWGLCKRTRVIIDSHQLVVMHNFIGIKWLVAPPALRKNISVSKLIKSNSNLLNNQPLLRISAGSTIYYLNRYTHFTEAELEWLIQELNEWLNLLIINNS